MTKLFFLLTVLMLHLTSKAQVMWQFNKDTVITWNYQWGDEFNADKVDENKWSYWYGWARSIYSNKEQQYYTDGKNHTLENGILKLVARKEPVDARMVDWMKDNDTITNDGKFYSLNKMHFDYTSGMIKSKVEFLYGYFEMRFKAPKDKGMWPAFWIAGGDPNEEIDIMEIKGEKPKKIHVDTHCPNECDYFKNWYGKKLNWGGWVNLKGDLEDGYHVVAAEWQPDFVKYYLDGECIAISKVHFTVKKAVIANVAIAHNKGPFHPGPDKSFTRSEPFEIDYIRIWDQSKLSERKILGENNSMRTKFSELTEKKAMASKKDKFLYGKKSDHSKEGIFVSVFPGSGQNYFVYTLGTEKNKNVTIKIVNESNAIVLAKDISGFQTQLDLSGISKGTYRLIIECNGRKAEQLIVL